MMDELTYETKYLGLGTGDFPKPAYEEEEAYEYEEQKKQGHVLNTLRILCSNLLQPELGKSLHRAWV